MSAQAQEEKHDTDAAWPLLPDFLDVASGVSHGLHTGIPIPTLGPLGAYLGFSEASEAWGHGDAGGVMQGGASGLAGVASTVEALASLFGAEAAATMAANMAGPLAAGAIGLAVGNSLNNNAAKNNTFGANRKASTDAADVGDMVRTGARNLTGDEQIAQTVGGVTTVGMSVANTIDTAIDGIVTPPILRELMPKDGPGGIAGTGISIMDVVPGGAAIRAMREEKNEAANPAPNMGSVYAWMAAGAKPEDSPYKGMYD